MPMPSLFSEYELTKKEGEIEELRDVIALLEDYSGEQIQYLKSYLTGRLEAKENNIEKELSKPKKERD